MTIDNTPLPGEASLVICAEAPATEAARAFQQACLANVYEDFTRTYNVLRRMAKSRFPKRGDTWEVLDQTIFEYGLWRDAKPRGFWTAFERDMLDALKAAYNARLVPLDETDETEEVEKPSVVDLQISKAWLREYAIALRAVTVKDKWEMAQNSEAAEDRLICTTVQRLMEDEDYMDEVAQSKLSAAKLTRVAAEVCLMTGCSRAEAYRLIAKFRGRYSAAQKN